MSLPPENTETMVIKVPLFYLSMIGRKVGNSATIEELPPYDPYLQDI